jgi:hypothetical protein
MKRIATFLSALVLISAASLSLATPAQAVVDLMVCTGNETATFNPPLTVTPQQTTVGTTRSYAPCLSLSRPDIVSGAQSGSHPRTLGCATLLGGGSREFTVRWNTGETSTLSGTTITNIVGVTIVNVTTGTVTSGVFKGAGFEHTVTSPSLSITLCTLGGPPVSALSGVVNLVINGL